VSGGFGAAARGAPPSPTLATRGRVPGGDCCSTVPYARPGTSPLVGEAGRGGATSSALAA
jgi:hypothetical protein